MTARMTKPPQKGTKPRAESNTSSQKADKESIDGTTDEAEVMAFPPRSGSSSPIIVLRSLKKSARGGSRREVYLCREGKRRFVRKMDSERRIKNEVHALQQATLRSTPGLRVPELIAHSDNWVDIEHIEGTPLNDFIGSSKTRYRRLRPKWLELAKLFHDATGLQHGTIKSHSVILLDRPKGQRRQGIGLEHLVLIDFGEAQPAETRG